MDSRAAGSGRYDAGLKKHDAAGVLIVDGIEVVFQADLDLTGAGCRRSSGCECSRRFVGSSERGVELIKVFRPLRAKHAKDSLSRLSDRNLSPLDDAACNGADGVGNRSMFG